MLSDVACLLLQRLKRSWSGQGLTWDFGREAQISCISHALNSCIGDWQIFRLKMQWGFQKLQSSSGGSEERSGALQKEACPNIPKLAQEPREVLRLLRVATAFRCVHQSSGAALAP